MSKVTNIGFFDSGVGGLSVLRHAMYRVGGSPLIYIADSANTPYGTKTAEWITERSLHIGRFLIEQGCEAIVVACNTATAVAVHEMREQLSVPIVAMEPAIKPAVKQTKTGNIAVLATAGTLGSKKYSKLANDHLGQSKITNQTCQHWVEIVENGELDTPYTLDQINADLQPLIQDNCDTLVLGCTHFPFLTPTIKKVIGEDIRIIDPSTAVVDQLCRQLDLQLSTEKKLSSVMFYTSGETAQLQSQISQLLHLNAEVQAIPA